MGQVSRGILLLALLALTLSASTSVFDNLSQPPVDVYFVNGDGPLYASFSTGSSASTLTNVQIDLANDALIEEVSKSHMRARSKGSSSRATRPRVSGPRPRPQVPSSTTVALYSNAGDSPGGQLTVIGIFPDTSLPLNPMGAPVNFTLATPYPLAANTRYWIGLTGDAGGTAAWVETDTSTGTGVANEFLYADGMVFTNADAVDNEPFIMQVNVGAAPITPPSPTPAPSSLLLVLTGLVAIGVYLRRRTCSL